jgi:dTMP kinase
MSSPRTSGAFVVIEGIDGSGSTSQAKHLVERLMRADRQAMFTCEPTNGPIGVMIRQVLGRRLVVAAADGARAPDWRTMALLFAADRADHNDALIEPSLTAGKLVVSDRYVLSSLAYQSLTSPEGRANLDWLKQINSRARVPDLTIVLQVSPEVAALRRQQRGAATELYEQDSLQRRLAEFYRDASNVLDHPVCNVDADRGFEQVAESIWDAVQAQA